MSIFDPRRRGPQTPIDPDAISPYDNPVAAGLRFFMELMAVFGTAFLVGVRIEAVAGLLPGILAGLVTAVGLQAPLALFSTPGDKHRVFVPVAGPVRLIIELVYTALAVWTTWTLTPLIVAPEAEDAGAGAALGATVVILAWLLLGYRRLLWLSRGAPRPQA